MTSVISCGNNVVYSIDPYSPRLGSWWQGARDLREMQPVRYSGLLSNCRTCLLPSFATAARQYLLYCSWLAGWHLYCLIHDQLLRHNCNISTFLRCSQTPRDWSKDFAISRILSTLRGVLCCSYDISCHFDSRIYSFHWWTLGYNHIFHVLFDDRVFLLWPLRLGSCSNERSTLRWVRRIYSLGESRIRLIYMKLCMRPLREAKFQVGWIACSSNAYGCWQSENGMEWTRELIDSWNVSLISLGL